MRSRCSLCRLFPASPPSRWWRCRCSSSWASFFSSRAWCRSCWMRCPSGQRWIDARCTGQATSYNWAAAVRQADQISSNGEAFFNDWRVPTLRDLATITDRGCKNPRTNLIVFPGTQPTAFWTSTPRPGGQAADRAFVLSFGAEGVMSALKDERFYVRFVRNAM